MFFSMGPKSVRFPFPLTPLYFSFCGLVTDVKTGSTHPANRPRPPLRSAQNPSANISTAPQRESAILVRRHGSHHRPQFSRATTLKQELEERQRAKAKEREESGVEWQPSFSSVL